MRGQAAWDADADTKASRQGAAAAVNSGNTDASGVQAPGWAMDVKKALETGKMDEIWKTLENIGWRPWRIQQKASE
ncbi:hypothetical protein C8F04DRAFT_1259110 [Mycena alexandri]|uniref:Uncharacterized protein n=1 Tax=Mycena alexandri TaxID=1745969 RepID=A0AAD6SWF0_9AGAR|nr:hypothetical protein C8F04DRAFT_1259110 [Mycena alexandri]